MAQDEEKKEAKEVKIKKILMWYVIFYAVMSIIVYLLTGRGHAFGILGIGIFMTAVLATVAYFMSRKGGSEKITEDLDTFDIPEIEVSATLKDEVETTEDPHSVNELPAW